LSNDPSSAIDGLSREEEDARDEQLALLLGDLMERARQGKIVDIDQVIRANPLLGDELRELWGAAMLADAVSSQVSAEKSGEGFADDMPSATLELPARIGDYELQEEIGRGGMGVVYRAQHVSEPRVAAVKMILRGKLASSIDRARFSAEAEATSRLAHENIVRVHEVAEHDGQLYFTMDYIPGETLAQRLSRGPMLPREAATLLAKIARAIHYAHTQGVLHRDVKPSNILIDEDGQPHVTDFGLAKQTEDGVNLTRTGAVLGTPAYMAPEQAAGGRGRLGPPSDVYSLGVVLYHMLTGRPPFQAASPVDVVLMVLEQEPLPPRKLNPKADHDLETVALRCLQKPPDLRYDTAGAMADDLEAYLRGESISARSGRFGQLIARIFRDTHNAPVLENWGLLWMLNGLVLFLMCAATNLLYWWESHLEVEGGLHHRWPYFLLWTIGAGSWGILFRWWRKQLGPVTFVERQIAHVWAAAMISIALLVPVEYILDLNPNIQMPVLSLAPVLALVTGSIFLIKAGMLSGTFYLQAIALYLTAVVMAFVPGYAHLLFGTVGAACFAIPGWKYYRQRRASGIL